ncbi:MAG: alpha/beta hydrolase [Pseudomonadota bacterium]
MSYIFAETAGQPNGPLVFTFHGTGGDERQFHAAASQLMPGAHVISPRGDVSEFGANRFFRRTGEGVYDMVDLTKRSAAMSAFIEAKIEQIQPSSVLGFGYSNGANILASVLLKAPHLFDAAALLHPLIPWTPAAQIGLSGKRILVTAGRADPICPAPQTEAFLRYLETQKVKVTEFWHPGGHDLRPGEVEALTRFLNLEGAKI